MRQYLVIVAVLSVDWSSCGQEATCRASNGGEECQADTSMYSREANSDGNEFLAKIEQALKAYKPCHSTNCDCFTSVIDNDLKPFKQGISRQSVESVRTKGTKYQIIAHKLYRDKDCMFPSRCAGIEYFLLKIAPILSDMEMIVNTRDWPQIDARFGQLKGPVFSFSKTSHGFLDIMYPAWSFWEGGPAITLYPKGLGKWAEHRENLSREAAEHYPWEKKVDKAFFRGSRTSSERDALILLSRTKPDLVDAQYTKNQAWKSDADTLGAPPAAEASFLEHCRFKYLFNFRGVAASFRLKHLFLCRSAVFHVGDDWLEFFYASLLQPWVHYVPVNSAATASQLEHLLRQAKKNDAALQAMAERGFHQIHDYLTIDNVVCYWTQLLQRYGKLLKYEVKRDMDLVQIIAK